jgi:hypothetical protein
MSDGLTKLFKAHHIDQVWKHYRLCGAQADFTESTGMPVVRGNNQIEGTQSGSPATQSSCMTCHSRSTIGGRLDFHLGLDRVGAPNWNWFYGIGNTGQIVTNNYQRDFSWTLARAKPLDKAQVGIFWQISQDSKVYFRNDILPLFRKRDIDAMKRSHGVDISNYTDLMNQNKAELVLQCYMQQAEPKLPIGGPEWSDYLKQEFDKWLHTDGAKYSSDN